MSLRLLRSAQKAQDRRRIHNDFHLKSLDVHRLRRRRGRTVLQHMGMMMWLVLTFSGFWRLNFLERGHR
jgi:hypothetical protein